MGERNKVFRKMLDWFLAEDGHRETQEKRKWCRDLVTHTRDNEGSENWDLGPEHVEQVPDVVSFC